MSLHRQQDRALRRLSRQPLQHRLKNGRERTDVPTRGRAREARLYFRYPRTPRPRRRASSRWRPRRPRAAAGAPRRRRGPATGPARRPRRPSRRRPARGPPDAHVAKKPPRDVPRANKITLEGAATTRPDRDRVDPRRDRQHRRVPGQSERPGRVDRAPRAALEARDVAAAGRIERDDVEVRARDVDQINRGHDDLRRSERVAVDVREVGRDGVRRRRLGVALLAPRVQDARVRQRGGVREAAGHGDAALAFQRAPHARQRGPRVSRTCVRRCSPRVGTRPLEGRARARTDGHDL